MATSGNREDVHFSAYWAAAMASGMFVMFVALPIAVVALFVPTPWGYVLGVFALVAAAGGILRSRRISLTVASDGITVHNFWRSYRLPWSSVRAAEYTTDSMLESGAAEQIEFILVGDKRVLAQASVGRPARRDRILAAIRPYANDWNISMPESFS